MNYLDWNQKIAEYFFNEKKSGHEVILYVDESVIKKIGLSENSVQFFVNEVKSWDGYINYPGFCMKALHTYKHGYDKETEYPPYLAYLAIFVYASTINDPDIDKTGKESYYRKLSFLLNQNINSNTFTRIDELWYDLEDWSVNIREGSLGLFHTWIRGKHMHVGLATSQILITEDEREMLPDIFYDSSLSISEVPDKFSLKKSLIQHGRNKLNPKTIQFLEKSESSRNQHELAALNILLGIIQSAFKTWDGTCSDIYKDKREKLLLGLYSFEKITDAGKIIKPRVRTIIKSQINDDYLEEEIILADNRQNSYRFNFSLDSEISGPLLISDDDSWTPVEIGKTNGFSWGNMSELSSVNGDYHIIRREKNIRAFHSLEKTGYSGWIETTNIDLYEPLYIFVHSFLKNEFSKWLETGVAEYKEFPNNNADPEWNIYYCNSVRSSFSPFFSIKMYLEVSLEGGLKARREKTGGKKLNNAYVYPYFPDIIIEGGEGNEHVSAYLKLSENDEKIINFQKDSNILSKSSVSREEIMRNISDPPYDKNISVLVKIVRTAGSEIINLRNFSIHLVSSQANWTNINIPSRDCFGQISKNPDFHIIYGTLPI